ncbi:MAG: tetratricopeptide repeat protein [Hyphomonas sp.]|uniref:tetratricopeptide repeat protein n=1 Tax=Hyphomonas sp. TaxID=87 RepID=UPI0035285FFC
MPIIAAAVSLVLLQSAGEKLAAAEQDRLDACVSRIESEPEEAYEDGLAWTFEGNRPGARQCTALALIALGHIEEGASRLVSLANAADGGTLEQRAAYLSQAGNAFIEAGAADDALAAFDGALKIAPDAPELLVDRASAHFLLANYDKAIADLDDALSRMPDMGDAYQLRGQAWLAKGEPDKAMADVTAAMAADPENIDVLVLRGQVREAQRIEAESGGPLERISGN